ncbi:MAG: sigma-70 family RNA polymerase sigma factor [Actinomycetota bacterium]|nr:sigma-70 family RNA polymerase sigma factor [Actinomycetota bacterium]
MSSTPLSPPARALVEDHLPLVRHVLAGVAAHYPRHADREELAQAATLGLVEAAARFDLDRGVPFERWAALRIRGAIVDAVRALDFAPRALRSAARDVETARTALENELGRTPNAQETAERAGISESDLAALQGRVHRSLVLSLDAPCGEEDGDPLTLGTSIIDEVQLTPSEVLEHREQATYVRDALDCLPDRLRTVVVGYFLEGETSADLAARLGVTESRVSQMRTEALTLMRGGIQAQYEEPAVAPAAAEPGRQAYRQAAYAAALAARSSYSSRLTRVPVPRQEPAPVAV